MLKAPINKVVLKFKTKYIKYISDTMRRASIQQNASVDPVDLVNIVGEVVGLPAHITTDIHEYEGYSAKDIKIGDTAIVSYQVIYSFHQTEPDEEPKYKNQVMIGAEEYFMCGIKNVYAVIRNDEVIMVNGNCMIEDIVPPSLLKLPQYLTKKLNVSSGVLTGINNNLEHLPKINADKGNTVYFNFNKLQQYEINEKKFGIIKQSEILGVSE